MSNHDIPLLLGASPEEALVHCIFIHGRTQSPEDMQEQVISKLKVSGVAFVLPRARGNSWYDARATDVLTDRTRQQLEQAIAHVRQVIGDLPGATDHPKPLVIGGFSQGACLAVEYAMRHGPWNGALASLTGCRVGTPACDRPFADLDRLPVYLTGSDKDPWIPVDAFAQTAAALARARARLHCDILPDRSHEVSATEIAQLERVLCGLSNRSWW
ncbi:phospholipase [Rhizobium sp. P40RR-XXII]|uniref:alpha/beta hydrolase n=1 Tax=unclassified Rhizobium TaxID=2613769 RepID=UPI0014577A6D|nr:MULTISPECIES: phospholipase [unclassified Rhizobium]NLR89138.1 phospholipase [Rhizobium sp. P28RR-XV]NLS21044.1 phospholipase [Rhizobium sp. P40RR-XXII]